MRYPSLTAFGGGGSPAVTSILRPSAGCPKVADLATIVGHSTTEVWADDPIQGIDVTIPLLMGGLQARVMALKNPPYSIIVGLLAAWGPTGNVGWGIALRESSTGKLLTWGTTRFPPPANGPAIGRWTDVNTYTAPFAGYGSGVGIGSPIWFRLDDDGINRHWYSSNDGRMWLSHDSEASGTFIVPNQVGLFIIGNANTGSPITDVVRFFEFTVT